ncbi:16S rRNA (cytidine1402-2'-O)-methyltransferase [Cyclonatronum proteinivorum]|uniref:Ribosomal RNA small subunit methyltransferase I n=1 Tax=Cyclonatronum proteinivorum TaxID=1457365 RepID=A0A345UL71_9BACT|nr:16S rRNA (cytidine(1402)-2'-O)-methyltransferase [Cyclonatronum proteinivorum]AXJ01223.1 16S rRNA (cytidine1402-2'-O)-methyltransferase [Cyclonatronum proteinivorum]
MTSNSPNDPKLQQAEAGTLYLVGTPIGNLQDFSPRALQILKTAALIACEDTRTSGLLLRSSGVETPLTSYHQHNEHRKTEDLIARLRTGEAVALISDAGMPAISDPGFLLARAAHQAGIRVVPVPGPVAGVTALAASGLPSDRFVFEGFLPPKKGRKTRITAIAEEERTVVLYESPHRIEKLLRELLEACDPARLCAIGRELTKRYEEILRGSLTDVHRTLQSRAKQRGEFVFILAGKSYAEAPEPQTPSNA